MYGVIGGAIAGMIAVLAYGPGAVILVAALAVIAAYVYYMTHQKTTKKRSKASHRTLTAPIIGFVVIGMFSLGGAHYYDSSFATTGETCTATALGGKNTIGDPNSRWALSEDGTVAIAHVVVEGGESCEQQVTIAVWQAPDGDKGQPYELQKFHGFATYTLAVGTNEVRIQLPDCFYQVDLLRGTDPRGIDGGPVYPVEVMMASLHGGTKACVVEESTGEGTTPPVVNIISQSPTPLPSVGPGGVLIVSAFAALSGYIAHRLYRYRSETAH